MNKPIYDRIATAQRGLDYANCYAAATGAPTAKRKSKSARAARGAKLLRGPFLAPG
jgi:hypothetical protein